MFSLIPTQSVSEDDSFRLFYLLSFTSGCPR